MIIQFDNRHYIIFTIKYHEVCDFAIKLIAHFHLIVRDQSAKRDLCQNVMMRKGIFQTCKHPAFKSSNDALRIEFLLTGEEMWEEQAN